MQNSKENYHVIGLMSGTSVDGLDIAYCRFTSTDKWKFEILHAQTADYPDALRKKLKSCYALSAEDLTALDHELGTWIGHQVKGFISKNSLKPDLIASHGHTVFHQPHRKFTLQIGNLFDIYREGGIPVVGDFRSLDVALGGQGAPLVPFGDLMLFSEYDFCLNLGGFANISFDDKHERVAYDICPANIVLNHLSGKKGLEFDESGKLASVGSLVDELFQKLNNQDYYGQKGPKSLGVEWVNQNIIPVLENDPSSIENKLTTFCHHIGYQISQSIKSASAKQNGELLVTGGGAFNEFLVGTIQQYLGEEIACIVPESNIISFKEALVFAYLGLMRYQNKINTLKSVTGASQNSSGGVIVNNSLIF